MSLHTQRSPVVIDTDVFGTDLIRHSALAERYEILSLEHRDIGPLHGTVTVVHHAHEIAEKGRIFVPPASGRL